jgi:hypothetical protein
MTDEEWALIADLVAPYWSPGKMGRPVTVERRRVLDAIFYVAATGCQWRALPERYPNWNTVHRYHLAWSRDGAWVLDVAVRHAVAEVPAHRDDDHVGREPEAGERARGQRHGGGATSHSAMLAGPAPLSQRRTGQGWRSRTQPATPDPQRNGARGSTQTATLPCARSG